MEPVPKSIKLLEAHDEWPPFVRINPVMVACHQNRFLDMDTLHTNLKAVQTSALHFIVISDVVNRFDFCFHLDVTFQNARWRNSVGRHWGQAGNSKFVSLEPVAF